MQDDPQTCTRRMSIYGPCEVCGNARDIRTTILPNGGRYSEMYCPNCETKTDIARVGPSITDCVEAAMHADPSLTVEEAIRTVPISERSLRSLRLASCFFWDGYDCHYEMLFLGCQPCESCPPFDEREDLIHLFID